MKSKNSIPSPARPFVAEKLKKSLWFTLASSSASLMLLAPMLVSASIFSIPSFLSSFTKETSAAESDYNSQTVPLLAPAVNIDPTPSIGGGDIAMVGGVALLSEDGPSGTAADIENALPEASAISVYVVHAGDTLSEIAEMFNVSVNTIAWANNIQGRIIHEGQELVILPITGVRHTVAKGETLASVAKKYEGNLEEIANYNELATNASLAAGQIIIIPDGVVAAPRSSAPSAPLRGGSGPSIAGYYLRPVAGGVVTQGIHGYNGIDIGAPTGTGILASAAGTVIIAKGGGAWNGGYGNYIVIQHDNGTQTLYAHAREVYVVSGARVAQGATIGAVGSTGKSTGSHLHFEVRGAKNPFGR